MSTGYACPLGLTPQQLSAWRDRLAAPEEARRIEAHVRACDACRSWLAEFDRLAEPLRTERVPEPDERLWQAVRMSLVDPSRRGGSGRGGGPHGRSWSALAAVAAVLLLALGFAALFHSLVPGRGTTGQPTPTASPTGSPATTPTASPTSAPTTGKVAWQTLAWPQGMAAPDDASQGPAFSQADGNTAYLCHPGASQHDPQQVWATHNLAAPNHGVQWTRLADLPVTAQEMAHCSIIPDLIDPATLLVIDTPQTGQTQRNFASLDGGKTWREITQPSLYFQGSLATYQGKVYAVISTIFPTYPQFGNYSLFVSSDQMRTWRPVSSTVLDGFWMAPSGQMLAHLRDSRQFISSDDLGQSWHAFLNPSPFDVVSLVVRMPAAAGQPWTVCGLTMPSGASSSSPTHGAAVCTRDLGKTYRTLPALPGTPDNSYDPVGATDLLGVTSDGSVLAKLSVTSVPKDQGTSTGYPLWRLAPGSTHWDLLGTLPQFAVTYEPGVLSAQPDPSVPMRSCPTCQTDQAYYVAVYP